jgi:hypothetical protein
MASLKVVPFYSIGNDSDGRRRVLIATLSINHSYTSEKKKGKTKKNEKKNHLNEASYIL